MGKKQPQGQPGRPPFYTFGSCLKLPPVHPGFPRPKEIADYNKPPGGGRFSWVFDRHVCAFIKARITYSASTSFPPFASRMGVLEWSRIKFQYPNKAIGLFIPYDKSPSVFKPANISGPTRSHKRTGWWRESRNRDVHPILLPPLLCIYPTAHWNQQQPTRAKHERSVVTVSFPKSKFVENRLVCNWDFSN